MTRSGLQKEVISLYRDFLRTLKKRQNLDQLSLVRSKFKANASISRRDLLTIEHMLGQGRRQLERLQSSHVDSISVFSIQTNRPATAYDPPPLPPNSKTLPLRSIPIRELGEFMPPPSPKKE
eukprot:TRINITY_DN6330_c0_g1_i1.p1 TRINITY_DN6330_c0_g1~~TRINITY_DN6330_c0_g1_i1.p1  ORF type:complete len:122 (+),score=28.61 TRINITY_DN6330_c0_g1_i1:128-493(+)